VCDLHSGLFCRHTTQDITPRRPPTHQQPSTSHWSWSRTTLRRTTAVDAPSPHETTHRRNASLATRPRGSVPPPPVVGSVNPPVGDGPWTYSLPLLSKPYNKLTTVQIETWTSPGICDSSPGNKTSLELTSLIWTPSNTVPFAHLSPHPKRHLDRFSCFCRAHSHYRQIDRPTDHAAPSAAIGHIYLVLWCGLIKTIDVKIN